MTAAISISQVAPAGVPHRDLRENAGLALFCLEDDTLAGAEHLPSPAGGAKLVLSFDPNGSLKAHLTKAVLSADGLLTRANYSLASNPAPPSGSYTVLLPAPPAPGGTAATAAATVLKGKITGLTLTTPGSGYLVAPAIYFYSATRGGASAVATVSNGVVTGLTVLSGGRGYPDGTGSAPTPTVTIDLPSAYLPSGNGYALMTAAAGGSLTLAGALADGTAGSAAGLLNGDGGVALYTVLPYRPGPAGLLSGTLTFEDLAQTSDADGALTWTKPPQTGASLDRSGFTATVAAIASRYVPPAAKQQALVFTNALLGAATLTLAGGDLATSIDDALTVNSANLVHETLSSVPAPGDKSKLTLSSASGLFSGSCTGGFAIGGAPAKSLAAPFRGVLFQKQNRAAGFFVEGNHGGAVSLAPQEVLPCSERRGLQG